MDISCDREGFREDLVVELHCFFLFFFPFLSLIRLLVRESRQNLEQELFTSLVFHEYLEVEGNLTERLKLFKPHFPHLSKLGVLPHFEGSKSYRDESFDSTFLLKLVVEPILGLVHRSYLNSEFHTIIDITSKGSGVFLWSRVKPFHAKS